MKHRKKIISVFVLIVGAVILNGLFFSIPNAGAATYEGGNYSLTLSNLSSVSTSLSNLSRNITYNINITNNDNVSRTYNITASVSGSAQVLVNYSSSYQIILGNLSDSNRSSVVHIFLNDSSSERVNVTIFATLASDSSVVLNSSGEINLTSVFDSVAPNLTIRSPRNTTYYLGEGINQTLYLNASSEDNLVGGATAWVNNGTTDISLSTLQLKNLTSGTYNWTFFANDSLGNIVYSNITFTIASIPANYTIINQTHIDISDVNVTVLPFEYSNLSRIDSNRTSTEPVYLDLSQKVDSQGNASLGMQNLTLSRNYNGVNFTVEFLENTIVSGGSGWSGSDFLIPTNVTLSGASAPNHGSNYAENMRMIIKVGSGQELNLSRPARIVLPGMSSRLPAWGSSNSFSAITTNCTSDGNYSNIYFNTSPRECRVTNGSDMIIWTYHLSYFGAYNITYTAPSSGNDDEDTSTSSPSDEEEEEFWLNTTTRTSKDLSEWKEINVTLKAKYQVSFKVEKKVRYLGVISVSPTSAKINVTSSAKPHAYPFAVGETRKLELTGDNFYDVEVKVTSIKGVNVNVTLSYVHLPVNSSIASTTSSLTGNSVRNVNGTNSSGLEEGEEDSTPFPIWKILKIILIVIGGILVLGGIGGSGYLFLRHFYKEKSLASKVKVKSQDDD